MARSSWGCSQKIQERAKRWMGATTKNTAVSTDAVVQAGGLVNQACMTPSHFYASCEGSEAGDRDVYQVLAIRPHQLSPVLLAAVCCVWRGGIHANTARKTQKVCVNLI